MGTGVEGEVTGSGKTNGGAAKESAPVCVCGKRVFEGWEVIKAGGVGYTGGCDASTPRRYTMYACV